MLNYSKSWTPSGSFSPVVKSSFDLNKEKIAIIFKPIPKTVKQILSACNLLNLLQMMPFSSFSFHQLAQTTKIQKISNRRIMLNIKIS